jgi:hypothetical protein
MYIYSNYSLYSDVALMEPPDTHYCSCGRPFPSSGPLRFHQRACKSTKKRLNGALALAKEIWEKRKKPRLDEEPGSPQNLDGEPILELAMGPPVPQAVQEIVSGLNC